MGWRSWGARSNACHICRGSPLLVTISLEGLGVGQRVFLSPFHHGIYPVYGQFARDRVIERVALEWGKTWGDEVMGLGAGRRGTVHRPTI